MRFRITSVAVGLILSFALPRLLRAPVYSTWTILPNGERNFNLDERDLKVPRWREREELVNAINLPAMAITVPVQLVIWRGRQPYQSRMLFLYWSAILFGIPFWSLFGKFAGQTWAMFRALPFDAPTKFDWTFAAICTLLGGFFTCFWFSGPTDLPDMLAFAVGGTFWLLVGLLALCLRTMQFRGIRNATRHSAVPETIA